MIMVGLPVSPDHPKILLFENLIIRNFDIKKVDGHLAKIR
jgi:hypothetical protein